MLTFTDEQLREKLKSETGHDASHLHFHAFTDVEQSVRNQLEKLRNYPLLIPGTDIHGFVYDVRSGKLQEVKEQEARAASLEFPLKSGYSKERVRPPPPNPLSVFSGA